MKDKVYKLIVMSGGHFSHEFETRDFDKAKKFYKQNFNLDTCAVVLYINGEKLTAPAAWKLFGVVDW